jgi:hypothetical protein
LAFIFNAQAAGFFTMNIAKSVVCGMMLLVTGALSGCETTPFSRNDEVPVVEAGNGGIVQEVQPMEPMAPMDPIAPEGLPLSTNTRFADIPLPLGAKEDLDRTYVFESQGFRVGRMVYTSRDTVSEVAQFYIRECPVADWKLNSAVQAEGVQLQFSKGSERLDVSVQSPGVGRATVLILHLTPMEGAGVN